MPTCYSLAAVVQAPVGPPTGKRLTGQTVRFASATTPGDTGTLSPQPLDALEKHLDSLESEPSNGLGHEVRAKARQALQCLLEGNQRFCQVRAGDCKTNFKPFTECKACHFMLCPSKFKPAGMLSAGICNARQQLQALTSVTSGMPLVMIFLLQCRGALSDANQTWSCFRRCGLKLAPLQPTVLVLT